MQRRNSRTEEIFQEIRAETFPKLVVLETTKIREHHIGLILNTNKHISYR
jgi:hypothetical protein